MRRYLLDTGPLNAFLFNRPGALALIAPWIRHIDTLIAATALERNLTVVTTDSDYQRVPGLNVMLLTRADLVGQPGP